MVINRFKKPSLPNLVVAQRVIDKMTAAAGRYLQDETGEAMVGLVVNQAHSTTVYMLDTIAPPEGTAVREWATFQQGDEIQEELFWWLAENWRVYRQKRRDHKGRPLLSKFDVPLAHVGDWHKQPGAMIQPSTGDLMTARAMLVDSLEFLIAPIVTLGHPSDTALSANTNFVTVPQGNDTLLRVDFWYLDRYSRDFAPIVPAVYPDDQLPGLPESPWHLMNEARYRSEYQKLTENLGFVSPPVPWNVEVYPPLHICFLAANQQQDNEVLIVSTPWNYPAAPPSAYVAPFRKIEPDGDIFEVFEELWDQSKPVKNPANWTWSEGRFLIDYVFALEESLGWKRSAPQVVMDDKPETQS